MKLLREAPDGDYIWYLETSVRGEVYITLTRDRTFCASEYHPTMPKSEIQARIDAKLSQGYKYV